VSLPGDGNGEKNDVADGGESRPEHEEESSLLDLVSPKSGSNGRNGGEDVGYERLQRSVS